MEDFIITEEDQQFTLARYFEDEDGDEIIIFEYSLDKERVEKLIKWLQVKVTEMRELK